jgi:hypothetical protein
MSVKKTSSPLSSGAESLDPLGGAGQTQRGERVEKNFEAALAELAGEVESAGAAGGAENPTRAAFQQIAANADLEAPEEALAAVRESARYLVGSRLKEDLRESEQGRKIAEDLSVYIARDPLMHRKILSILQKLK